MLVALVADAPCIGVLFVAGLQLVLMATLTVMYLSSEVSSAPGSDLKQARIRLVRHRPRCQ